MDQSSQCCIPPIQALKCQKIRKQRKHKSSPKTYASSPTQQDFTTFYLHEAQHTQAAKQTLKLQSEEDFMYQNHYHTLHHQIIQGKNIVDLQKNNRPKTKFTFKKSVTEVEGHANNRSNQNTIEIEIPTKQKSHLLNLESYYLIKNGMSPELKMKQEEKTKIQLRTERKQTIKVGQIQNYVKQKKLITGKLIKSSKKYKLNKTSKEEDSKQKHSPPPKARKTFNSSLTQINLNFHEPKTETNQYFKQNLKSSFNQYYIKRRRNAKSQLKSQQTLERDISFDQFNDKKQKFSLSYLTKVTEVDNRNILRPQLCEMIKTKTFKSTVTRRKKTKRTFSFSQHRQTNLLRQIVENFIKSNRAQSQIGQNSPQKHSQMRDKLSQKLHIKIQQILLNNRISSTKKQKIQILPPRQPHPNNEKLGKIFIKIEQDDDTSKETNNLRIGY